MPRLRSMRRRSLNCVKIRSLKPQERTSYLLKGAQAEGELVYYGTLPIDEFLPLARVFNGRYRSIALQHYFSPRDGFSAVR